MRRAVLRIGEAALTTNPAERRFIEQRLELADHEANGLTLHLRAELVLFREHGDRRGAVRAMIEKRDVGIEQPVFSHEAMRFTPSSNMCGSVSSEITMNPSRSKSKKYPG